MTDPASLPARLGPNATLQDVITAFQALQDWVQSREPSAFGGRMDKFLTIADGVQAGLLAYKTGGSAGGTGGDSIAPGPITSNPDDASQPTPIGGLIVTPGVGFFFVEFDAPTYPQGGGNGRTIIYGANYSGTGPLPTFGSAVEVGTVPGRSTIAVISAEPGVQTHFWAKAETRHPTLQATPTGGTNGVYQSASLIVGYEHIDGLSITTALIANLAVTSAKILSLSVAKLTAGSIAVGEYIQSTGFVSGSAGWQINGNGVAEFSGVIVRGTLYATAGTIGGATIASTYVQSSNYVASTTGWKLDNTLGKVFANSILIRNAGATRLFDLAATGSDPVLKVDSAFEILASGTATFGGILTASSVITTDNIQANAVLVPLTTSSATTYTGTAAAQTVLTYTFTVPAGGDVISIWEAECGFSSGGVTFTVDIQLNGTSIGLIAGNDYVAIPVAVGLGAAAVGSNTLVVSFNGPTTMTLKNQKLIVIGAQR